MNKTASFQSRPVQSRSLPLSLCFAVKNRERMSWCLISPSGLSSIALLATSPNLRYGFLPHTRRFTFRIRATTDGVEEEELQSPFPEASSSPPSALGKDLKKVPSFSPTTITPGITTNIASVIVSLKDRDSNIGQATDFFQCKQVVNKTAATFAPRASTASKNPAVPGTTLYQVFEVQGYASMLLGGLLSFNLLFPSNEPDLWRLMGMWSIWMFTIPSLRARDCPSKEKEALNYLFLIIPLLNVAIPFFWKSFALVWSADTLAFFAMYAWKVYLLQSSFLPNYLFLVVALAHIRFCLLLQLGWLERTD